MQIKDKRTSLCNGLRDLLALSMQNEDHPIGVFAPDGDVYPLYSDLFDPILRDLN